MKHYSILVIGGGPGGYSAAIAAGKKAKETGKTVALFEKGALGGTCLNVGCIPTKYLYDKAATLEKIRALTEGGVFRDAGMFSFKKIMEGKNETVEKLTRGVGALLASAGVEVIRAEAALKDGHTVLANGETYTADHIILATGAEVARLPIRGAELALDSTDALSLRKVPKSLAVIGGGVIGLELASAYAAFGSKVTVIEFQKNLLPMEEPMAVRKLEAALVARGIEIKTGAAVTEIREKGEEREVLYTENQQTQSLSAAVVLMAVGRKPNLKGVDPEALGLVLSKGAIPVNDQMQTAIPGLYAIGDIAFVSSLGGTVQLAHAAYAEGEIAVQSIFGEDSAEKKPNLSGIPHAIYTLPTLASVGYTSEGAKRAGFDPVVGTFDYAGSGMAMCEGAKGCVYAVMDKTTEKALGFTVLGENAAEMIAYADTALQSGWTAEDFASSIVAHPSLSEMLKEAALAAFGRAIHK